MSDNGDQVLEIDGLDIRYRVSRVGQPPRGRVLILPGFTEFIEKYEEATENHKEPPCKRFNDLGFDTLVLDWPGQGRSTRLTGHSKHLIHSRGFDFHLDCLDEAAKKAGFTDDSDTPLFIFGHSMGGHLALRYAAEKATTCRGVIVTSPMILPPIRPKWGKFGWAFDKVMLTWGMLGMAQGVLLLAKGLCKIGLAEKPTLFQCKYPRDEVFYKNNSLTRDPEGYAVQPRWWARDVRLRGHRATCGWVRDAFESCLATTAKMGWMRRLTTPVSAHIAGDERIVSLSATRRRLPHIPNCEIYDDYSHARHELLHELPDVVETIWGRVEEFLNKRLDAG